LAVDDGVNHGAIDRNDGMQLRYSIGQHDEPGFQEVLDRMLL
jgi:hypothetical protein